MSSTNHDWILTKRLGKLVSIELSGLCEQTYHKENLCLLSLWRFRRVVLSNNTRCETAVFVFYRNADPWGTRYNLQHSHSWRVSPSILPEIEAGFFCSILSWGALPSRCERMDAFWCLISRWLVQGSIGKDVWPLAFLRHRLCFHKYWSSCMAVEIEKTNVRLILYSLNTFLSPEMLLSPTWAPPDTWKADYR